LLNEFCVWFSDIDAICRSILAELPDVEPQLQWWKRIWQKFWRCSTSDSSLILNFISNVDESQVIELASKALGKTSSAHKKFNECHQHKGDSTTVIHRNRIKARRQRNHAASAVAQVNKTFRPFNVHATDCSEQHVIGVAAAATAACDDVNVQTSKSTFLEMPDAQVRDGHILRKNEASASLKSRPRYHAANIELEEVVVLPADSAFDPTNSASNRYRVDAVFNSASRALEQMDDVIREIDEHVLNTNHSLGFGNPKLSAEEHLKIVKMQHAIQFKDGDMKIEGNIARHHSHRNASKRP
jgi:hypothetical protein